MTAESIPELVEERARGRQAHQPLFSFVEEDETWTPADLARRASRAAGALRRAGVRPGERVGLLASDRRSFLDAFFGAQHLGVVAVPLPTKGRRGSEVWVNLVQSWVERFALSALATEDDLLCVCADAVSVPVVIADGAGGPAAPAGPPSPIAYVQPSSGTTGEPRGVVLSQQAVLANLAAIADALAIEPDDCAVTWLPFYHDMGLIGTVLAPLFGGGRSYVWSPERFLVRPKRWLELMAEVRATIAVAPPFALELLRRMATRRDRAWGIDLSSLRAFLVGAELVRPQVIEGFVRAFASAGVRRDALIPVYGLAEAVLAVTTNPLGAGPQLVEVGGQPSISCGFPVAGTRIRVSKTGEVLVHTPSVMEGYLDDPESTRRAFDDGWLRTGDLGEMTDIGLVVLGRVKEMLNRNGVRIPPYEVERVAGGADHIRPDRVVAFELDDSDGDRVVVLAESPAWRRQSRDHVIMEVRRRLGNAGFEVDIVDLVPVGFIPKTTSGKLRRIAARAAYASLRTGAPADHAVTANAAERS